MCEYVLKIKTQSLVCKVETLTVLNFQVHIVAVCVLTEILTGEIHCGMDSTAELNPLAALGAK